MALQSDYLRKEISSSQSKKKSFNFLLNGPAILLFNFISIIARRLENQENKNYIILFKIILMLSIPFLCLLLPIYHGGLDTVILQYPLNPPNPPPTNFNIVYLLFPTFGGSVYDNVIDLMIFLLVLFLLIIYNRFYRESVDRFSETHLKIMGSHLTLKVKKISVYAAAFVLIILSFADKRSLSFEGVFAFAITVIGYLYFIAVSEQAPAKNIFHFPNIFEIILMFFPGFIILIAYVCMTAFFWLFGVLIVAYRMIIDDVPNLIRFCLLMLHSLAVKGSLTYLYLYFDHNLFIKNMLVKAVTAIVLYVFMFYLSCLLVNILNNLTLSAMEKVYPKKARQP